MGCAQLKITGTGTKGSCGPTISLPGTYKKEDKNIYIPNFYNGFDASSYKAPGGDVATCGGSGNATPAEPAESSAAAAPASSAPAASSAAASPVQSEAAATSAPAAASSSAAAATSVVAETPVASATAAPSTGSGDELPEKFTLETFVAWLQKQAA